MISIVVTIYNIEKYIEKCINSILLQTFNDFELILVDDGSTDNSGFICDTYAKQDRRIRVIHQTNCGQVEARHAGANIATGDYIICIDGDDWIGPERIKTLVKSIHISDADMIFMDGIIRVYDGGKEDIDVHTFDEGVYSTKEVISLLANTDFCFKRILSATTCSWAIKRDVFLEIMNRVDKEVVVGEDFLFTWLGLLATNTVYLSKNLSYYYYQREGSLSRNADNRILEPIKKAYLHINDELDKKTNTSVEYKKVLIMATMRIIVATCFNRVLIQSDEYLYPYSSVKSGSKVLVYGVGDVGVRLIAYLANSPQYEVVGWLDKYSNKRDVDGVYKVEFKDISTYEFDYIAIAVADYDVVNKIKIDLINRGIAEEKIATMDAKVIDEEHLLKCFES